MVNAVYFKLQWIVVCFWQTLLYIYFEKSSYAIDGRVGVLSKHLFKLISSTRWFKRCEICFVTFINIIANQIITQKWNAYFSTSKCCCAYNFFCCLRKMVVLHLFSPLLIHLIDVTTHPVLQKLYYEWSFIHGRVFVVSCASQ